MDVLDEITTEYIRFLYVNQIISDRYKDSIYPILYITAYERLYHPSTPSLLGTLKSSYNIG